MKSEELRALQAPLKEKYKDNPDTAIVTLKATGKISDGISCSVETGRALVKAGLHPASGGDGSLICSGDVLLEALVACSGVTMSAVATSMRINLRDVIVSAEGDIDFRGTLAVDKDVPVGFKNIRLNFSLDTDETEEKIFSLMKLTERYCVVFQTLTNGVPVSVTHSKK
jgi:uncharacterized OsmC-like protein